MVSGFTDDLGVASAVPFRFEGTTGTRPSVR